MNFFKDKELAIRFKNDRVPSHERLLYLLAFLLLGCGMMSSWFVYGTYYRPNLWDAGIDVISAVSTIIGTVICYRTNRAGDDKEFIDRYFSLGFPVAIQAILLLAGLGVAYGIAVGIMGTSGTSEETGPDLFASMLLFTAFYYWRLNNAFKIAS